MARRCVLAATLDRLGGVLDDGQLDAHRRRLLQRAAGRVLDLSLRWEDNLDAYRAAPLTALAVAGAPGSPGPPLRFPEPSPGLAYLPAGLADADLEPGTWDTVVVVLTLCCADEPAGLLAGAARALAPGGQILVLEHVAGTGLTGAVQHLVSSFDRSLGSACRADVQVTPAARSVGLAFEDCARFRLRTAATVRTPCLAGVARHYPGGAP